MKKIITFEKELTFPSMIGEINSISLDQDVKFLNSTQASGNLTVSGTYKLTEASTLLENFKYDIPVEISLTETLDLESSKVSISDFDYEIVNDDTLKCKIDLLVEGVETITIEEEQKEEEKEEQEEKEELVRECDGDKKTNSEKEEKEEKKEIFEQIEEEKNEISIKEAEIDDIKEEKSIDTQSSNISSLFQAFENSTETFTTYSVYIMRKDDTLEKVLDKYKISIDALEEYNDLSNLEIGSKLIIPSINE